MNISAFALKNLRRNRGRTGLLLAVIAAASFTLFSTSLFLQSASNALGMGVSRLGADIFVVPADAISSARSAMLSGKPAQFYMDRTILNAVEKVQGVKAATPQLYLQPAGLDCCADIGVFLTAFDPATDFTVMPWLDPAVRKELAANELIIGRNIPLTPGSNIGISGSSFKVAKKLDSTGMAMFDKAMFMNLDAAYRTAESATGGEKQKPLFGTNNISAVLVKVKAEAGPERVGILIERAVPGVKTIVSEAFASILRKQFAGISRTVVSIGVILWIIVLLIISFAFTMIMNERQREIGLLRAMGASRGHIAAVPLIEASLLTTAGGLAGILSGAGLLALYKDVLHDSFSFPFLMPSAASLTALAVNGLFVSIITGLLAVLLPAVRAARWDPYDCIRKEE